MSVRFIPRLLLLVLATLAAHAALAGEFFEKDGAALRSYDPVAYFTAGKSQKGLPSHSYEYKETTFHFATDENRRAFMQDPEKYVPQFGGYCAYGTAQGYKVSTQPDAFAIHLCGSERRNPSISLTRRNQHAVLAPVGAIFARLN